MKKKTKVIIHEMKDGISLGKGIWWTFVWFGFMLLYADSYGI